MAFWTAWSNLELSGVTDWVLEVADVALAVVAVTALLPLVTVCVPVVAVVSALAWFVTDPLIIGIAKAVAAIVAVTHPCLVLYSL